jgi:GNAT superfamily N-acetyltransferase
MARRHGVGLALMQQAEMLAEEWNVQRMQLDSWDFNTQAHAFFERSGFERFNFRFWKQL